MNPTKEEIERALSWADYNKSQGEGESAICILADAYREAQSRLDAFREVRELDKLR